MGFRIKHIPSGLYYIRQKNKEINLNSEGTVFDTIDQCYFILKANGFALTIGMLEGSQSHLKIENIYNFFKYKSDDVYTYANTLPEEWIVEPINEEE
jgi:hypothetical protein